MRKTCVFTPGKPNNPSPERGDCPTTWAQYLVLAGHVAPLQDQAARNDISLRVYRVSFIIPAAKQIATVAQLVEQTIRNRQVMGSNPIGGSPRKVVFPL
jgi:hypothetical protein